MSTPAGPDRPPRPPGRHLVLVGPTAAGKSALALALARRRRDRGEPVEIVSMDSMAVYRGMDIGTTTPAASERADVPHHLLDLVGPDEEFSVARFARAAREVLDDLERRGAAAVMVGGTGLYVRAVVDDLDVPGRFPQVRRSLESEPDTPTLHRRLVGLDPVAASRVDPDNRRRVVRALEVTIGSGRPFSSFGPGLESHPWTPFVLAGLDADRERTAERIRARVHRQLADGWLDEVRRLRSAPERPSRTASQALGYRELAEHLDGQRDLHDAIDVIVTRTRQFSVRQIRWFRRDPRISWFDAERSPAALLEALDRHWRSAEADAAARWSGAVGSGAAGAREVGSREAGSGEVGPGDGAGKRTWR